MSEPTKGVLLVVDDEPLKRVTLQIELSEAGYKVVEVSDAVSAMQFLRSQPIDVVITDLRMPGMDGLQFLKQIKSASPRIHVILMTAFGSIGDAIEAMKRGAHDFLTKPFKTEVLLEKLERLRHSPQWGGSPAVQTDVERFGSLCGRSHAARMLFEQIRQVADNERPVLIQGESGCGADRVAETIHQLSRRCGQPFIAVNCTAFSPHLLDAELFGSGRAFNGSAHADRAGRIDAARGGTLFLDEVEALPLEAQVRLLRLLDPQDAGRVAGPESAPMNVRILCATQRDLRELVDAGRFRQELFYRLAAVSVFVPPLRERRDDVALLAAEVLQRFAASAGTARGRVVPTRFAPHALETLVAYCWPGNILELEHTIERAISLCQGDTIELKDILLPKTAATSAYDLGPEVPIGLVETVAGVEKKLIDAALRRATGNQAKAAQFLGIPRTTLRDKMAKYGMVGNGNGGDSSLPPMPSV